MAQRKDAGEIHGSILIDGKPQGISFQRATGYCEQLDVHEKTATVREALVFSAVLRQPSSVSYEEKIAYVNHIINLLELSNIAEALIGGMSSSRMVGTIANRVTVPGAGLSIEQRKRVTLGVELVAKPTLLFLDEPTSGLDGQSAYNIVRFLRKLVNGGQAVLVCGPVSRWLTSNTNIRSAPFINLPLSCLMHLMGSFCLPRVDG